MKQLHIPIAIIISGVLIALSVIFSGGVSFGVDFSKQEFGNSNSALAINVTPIEEDDHVVGNRDAKVVIIEYSDFECPFCSKAHPTFEKITKEYDNVAWVYRHFPLTSIHSKAQQAAVASECVAELAGNNAFWSFAETLFENQKNLGGQRVEVL